jgi:hypothetical protein
MQIGVTDVAGNRTLSTSTVVDIRNGSQPNGRNASRFARLRTWFASSRTERTTASVGFNRRRSIRGTLTEATGKPIVGAAVEFSSRLDRIGADYKPVGSAITDERGRFRYLPRRGASRTIRAGYRAFTLDEQLSTIADATLRVAAGVRLTATRRVRDGHQAHFKGRLLGGPGQGGVVVTIYAIGSRSPGARHLIPVETLRSDRRGRFRYSYRFRGVAGRITYRFQAVVRAQRSYPYADGRSRPIAVTVG